METKELMRLMIGDILIAYHDDGETQHYFPVIVDGLDNNGTLVEGESYVSWKPLLKEDDYEEYADELNPIPLTPEILEKNGWKLHPAQAYNKEAGMFLDKGCDGNSWWWQFGNIPICPINYVHELQHCLRLCGLNDLADNFKV